MAENGNNDEDVSAELTKNVVISKSLLVLSFSYLISKRRLVYNEE